MSPISTFDCLIIYFDKSLVLSFLKYILFFAFEKINGIINLFVGAVKIQISQLKELIFLKKIKEFLI